MGSGCGDPIVESDPSSSGQLPVPVALNARSPTLFAVIIHESRPFVNTFLGKIEKFLSKKRCHKGSVFYSVFSFKRSAMVMPSKKSSIILSSLSHMGLV